MRLRPVVQTLLSAERFRLGRMVNALVASLPDTLTFSEDGMPVALILGRDPRWTELVERALQDGVKGIVVFEPSYTSNPRRVEDLSAKLLAAGTAICLDSQWASHPAIAALEPPLLADGDLVTSRVVAPSADSAMLFAQIQALSALGVDLSQVDWSKQTDRGYSIVALTDGRTRVMLRGVSSRAGSATLSIAFRSGDVEDHLHLPDRAASWPAAVYTVDSNGTHARPSEWESASRSLWRRLASDITAPTHDTGDVLRGLAHDLRTFALLESVPSRVR